MLTVLLQLWWAGAPAVRDQMELGRAAKRQQWLTGCLAVVALCCTLWFGHSLCQLSNCFKTQAPTDIAEPERVHNRSSGGRTRCGDEGRFYYRRSKKYEGLAWEEVGSSHILAVQRLLMYTLISIFDILASNQASDGLYARVTWFSLDFHASVQY